MSANRAVILGLTAAMALAGQPLRAQGSHRGGGAHPGGGGRPAGGGRPGGAYAVPRGSAPSHPGYAPRAGVAAARHPGAGTGGYYYGSRYGGHYAPYYGGRYYGYGYGHYRPYWNASFYFGWPYYSSGWWPYGSYGYYSPSYSVSYYGYPTEAPAAQPAGEATDSAYGAPRPLDSNRDAGRVRLEVRPEDASVYVDDEFWGNARETKFLTLRSGRHSIELVRPGFEVFRREVDVVRGETSDVLVELRRP
jgi:hypothetical protein